MTTQITNALVPKYGFQSLLAVYYVIAEFAVLMLAVQEYRRNWVIL